ncbi:MAG: phosphotransferase [Alphaproteobacteria bacterium]|nr:phosphotransferase [Alphaproteobacteria bacterium]
MIGDRAIVAQMLSAIRRDLGLVVQPDLTSPEARAKAAMMSDMLGHLVVWHRQEVEERDDAMRFERQFAAAEREKREAAARLANVETDVTPERLEAFLAERLAGPARVTSITRSTAGYSKDTYLFRAERADGRPLDAVVRRDLPFGPGENSVLDEFDLLQGLHGEDVPVAEPLWSEADERWLGQPFIVSRLMPGTSGTEAWDRDVPRREAVCRDLAGILARLHGADPAVFGMPGDGDPHRRIRAYVEEWRDRWLRHRIEPSPTLEAAFEWLLANVPQDVPRLVLVHGDVGFHNILTHQGRITALLDWEFAHLGDPAEDLGYCRQHVEHLIPWPDFLAAYEAAGGTPYRDSGSRFYEVWRGVRNAVCCAVAWNGFLRDWYPALKMGYQGVPLYRMFVCDVAKTLERATA